MSDTSNAIEPRGVTASRRGGRDGRAAAIRGALPPGLVLGSLGILGFSFSLPATRLAVADLDPWLVAFGRATVAGLLAAAVLIATRAPRPSRAQARRLVVVAAGVVVGFPLFTSLALDDLPSARGAVVIAVLPAATAVFAVLRAGEHPSPAFWAACAAGLAAVLGFVAFGGAGLGGGPQLGDAYLLAGVALCALGYAEGGALSRELGGARTICWALVVSLPLTLAVAAAVVASAGVSAGATAWLGFAYVSTISMFLGFFAWYAGLARGGVARIGQIQLAQPVLTLVWSAALLGEAVGAATVAIALLVLASVAATQRARVHVRQPSRAAAR